MIQSNHDFSYNSEQWLHEMECKLCNLIICSWNNDSLDNERKSSEGDQYSNDLGHQNMTGPYAPKFSLYSNNEVIQDKYY